MDAGRRVGPVSFAIIVGKMQRENPLPAGRYWVDVFEADQPAFRLWLESHSGPVKVVSTESHPADGGGPARDWYLFEVAEPVPWEGPGFPTIATNVTSSDDTVQKPPPEPGVLDQAADFVTSAATAGKRTITVVAVVAVALVAVSLGGRR